MLVVPAIDLEKGRAVRLYKGKYDQVSPCAGEPDELARDYIGRGAKRLHVVLLLGARDGAFSGDEDAVVSRIVDVRNTYGKETCAIQLGGGVRRCAQIRALFDRSVDMIILGTSVLIPLALESGFTMNTIKSFYQGVGRSFDLEKQAPEFDLIERLTAEERRRVIVAVDYRGDEIGLSGWEVSVPLKPAWVVGQLVRKGVSRFLLTNIERDGTMEGIDPETVFGILEATAGIDPKPEILISGGIRSEEDIETLAASPFRPDGVVIGKALYQKRLNFRSLVKRFQ